MLQDAIALNTPAELAVLLSQSSSDPHVLPQDSHGFVRHAQFATMSRLLTCLVNERLTSALCCVTTPGSPDFLLVTGPVKAANSNIWVAGTLVFQLRHRPILASAPDGWTNAWPVRLLDPEDLGLCAWRTDCVDLAQNTWSGATLECPKELMRHIGGWGALDRDAVEVICQELHSSMEHQAHAYAQQASGRTVPSMQKASDIDWEQSIVEGHATHPMHRARHALPPLEPLEPHTEFRHLRLRFVAVAREQMTVRGDYHELLMPLLQAAKPLGSAKGTMLNEVDLQTQVVVPVHPLHLPAVRARFPFARVLDFDADAEAQASLRTVSPKDLRASGLDIKLPLGVKTSSALRTISTYSAFLGPQLTPLLTPILAYSNAPLDSDTAKYLACILRRNPQSLCAENERAVVAAALTERLANGSSAVCALWPNLETVSQKREFLRTYTGLLFDAFLPPLMTHAFALRHINRTHWDFGGIMVHMPTFSRPLTHDSKSPEEAYGVAFHALVQCQIHRLVRALDLHYAGGGWQIVREEFARVVPRNVPLWQAWMREEVPLKSFVTMKLGGLYRDYVYSTVPNILLYRDEPLGLVEA
ncbi:IucC family-domain-containing protein [Kickxella alabastrina]|uniref:IucC family-domain-containing protein n=1 Tax=Kickxella alabastrina TaxID=61397 RepID=UPI00221E5AEA|nr:IucC family-domain-containing protein [Kickxella alabastrina]KAI7828511.1 IucC family-domain-containing protein [Kickxella alabastrina]